MIKTKEKLRQRESSGSVVVGRELKGQESPACLMWMKFKLLWHKSNDCPLGCCLPLNARELSKINLLVAET